MSTQVDALYYVANHPGLSPGEFAAAMWPDAPGWRKSITNNTSRSVVPGAGMPRAGGNWLGKLMKRGLLRRIWRDGGNRYYLTEVGLEWLIWNG